MRSLSLLALLAACCAKAPEACGDPDHFCEVPLGRYLARPPADWDGRSPLPMTVFFHAWRQSANTYYDGSVGRQIDALGVLGVYPDGADGSWSHQGSPSQVRDEIAFMDEVLADVRARWPIDEERTLAGGISQGGSMAWWLACNRPDAVVGFAPVAGAFWEPLPTECPVGPVNLLHTHGTADTTVPMSGRPLFGGYAQANVRDGLALFLGADGCPDEATRTVPDDPVTCEVWDGCTSGRTIELCLHDGGHVIPSGWVARAHAWRESLRAR